MGYHVSFLDREAVLSFFFFFFGLCRLPPALSNHIFLLFIQPPRPMAAASFGQRSKVLYRQHEPFRRYLHFQRRTAGSAGRGRYHRSAGCRAISSDKRLGGGRDGEREALSVEVDSYIIFRFLRPRGSGGRDLLYIGWKGTETPHAHANFHIFVRLTYFIVQFW